jgi:hypothetical protein
MTNCVNTKSCSFEFFAGSHCQWLGCISFKSPTRHHWRFLCICERLGLLLDLLFLLHLLDLHLLLIEHLLHLLLSHLLLRLNPNINILNHHVLPIITLLNFVQLVLRIKNLRLIWIIKLVFFTEVFLIFFAVFLGLNWDLL